MGYLHKEVTLVVTLIVTGRFMPHLSTLMSPAPCLSMLTPPVTHSPKPTPQVPSSSSSTTC